jgi:beta-lactamase superfamily II metal-dependent hydrolase
VFVLEVNGKRLLFPGDAELESWHIWAKHAKKELKPVDFLKVSHHGSRNGTPLGLLDKLLPKSRKKKAQVLVSTKRDVYGTKTPTPDESLLAELKRRCQKLYDTDGMDRLWVDVDV